MKAAVMTEVGKIEFVEREMPKINDDQVLVRIDHVGLCGSDIHYYQHGRIGDFVVENPIILGHESAGTVMEVGKNVKTLKKGDLSRRTVTCGKCNLQNWPLICADVVFMATRP